MKNNNNTAGNELQPQTNATPENFSLDKISNMDIINHCGALRYSLTQIVALLRPRVDPDEINRLFWHSGRPVPMNMMHTRRG